MSYYDLEKEVMIMFGIMLWWYHASSFPILTTDFMTGCNTVLPCDRVWYTIT